MSPDRTVLEIRRVRNKPAADSAFWHEAMRKRMTDAGYRLVADSIVTIDGRPCALLELSAPIGVHDFSYLIAIAVGKRWITIAEAGGEVVSVEKRKSAILRSIASMRPAFR